MKPKHSEYLIELHVLIVVHFIDLTIDHRRENRRHSPRNLHSPGSSSVKSFDLQVGNWRMETLGRDSESGSEEEFFDCEGGLFSRCPPSPNISTRFADSPSLAKWSSLDLLCEEDLETSSPTFIENNPTGKLVAEFNNFLLLICLRSLLNRDCTFSKTFRII